VILLRCLSMGLIVCVLSCSSNAPPQKNENQRRAAGDIEKTVRAVIGEQLKTNPDAIDMNKPLSGPPLNADDLDVVEIAMDLEERLGIMIPDEAIDGHGKRLTPSDLVNIVARAKQLPPTRKRK